MKKLVAVLGTLILALFLVSCGGKEETQGWTEDDVNQMLTSGAFSEELETLDCDVAWKLYGLEQAGLTREQLTGGTIYRSAGATCEELSLLVFDTEDHAKSAVGAMENYVQGQIQANQDYRPQEIPKLNQTLISQKGNTLLLVVAADVDKAQQAVK